LEEVKRKEARNREEVLEKRKKLGRKSPWKEKLKQKNWKKAEEEGETWEEITK
jgi:hypothetical protein